LEIATLKIKVNLTGDGEKMELNALSQMNAIRKTSKASQGTTFTNKEQHLGQINFYDCQLHSWIDFTDLWTVC